MAHAQVRDTPRATPAPVDLAAQPPAPQRPGAPATAPPGFRAVLRHRYCSRLLIASVTGRLPLGMVPVALILAARADGHSLATASLLAALYGIAPALGLPLLGRLADLRGLPLPCHLGAALVAAALGAVALVGTSHLAFTAVCAALAGAGCPPLEGGLRSLWPTLLPDAAHVRTAYTLDSSAQEIVYVTGPALAIAMATWLSPAAALALAAAATLAGSLVFATARPARTWRAVPRRPGRLSVLRPRHAAPAHRTGLPGRHDRRPRRRRHRHRRPPARLLAGRRAACDVLRRGTARRHPVRPLPARNRPETPSPPAAGSSLRGLLAPPARPAPAPGPPRPGDAARRLVRPPADRGQPDRHLTHPAGHLHRSSRLDIQRDAAGPGRRHPPWQAPSAATSPCPSWPPPGAPSCSGHAPSPPPLQSHEPSAFSPRPQWD